MKGNNLNPWFIFYMPYSIRKLSDTSTQISQIIKIWGGLGFCICVVLVLEPKASIARLQASPQNIWFYILKLFSLLLFLIEIFLKYLFLKHYTSILLCFSNNESTAIGTAKN